MTLPEHLEAIRRFSRPRASRSRADAALRRHFIQTSSLTFPNDSGSPFRHIAAPVEVRSLALYEQVCAEGVR
jgi:hypothetical protein